MTEEEALTLNPGDRLRIVQPRRGGDDNTLIEGEYVRFEYWDENNMGEIMITISHPMSSKSRRRGEHSGGWYPYRFDKVDPLDCWYEDIWVNPLLEEE
jgi:hypothetical protein